MFLSLGTSNAQRSEMVCFPPMKTAGTPEQSYLYLENQTMHIFWNITHPENTNPKNEP